VSDRGKRAARWVALALVLTMGATLVGTSGPARAAAPRGEESVAKAPQVDVNRASVEELQSLPGIGQVTAERIVAFREEHGPFRRVEDLMKVKGIGEKSFQKLRSRVKVSEDE
jgi:competence protein ComEA